MAPHPIESFEDFLKRLDRLLANGSSEIRFGAHHVNHAVCVEDGVFCVRKLEFSREEAEAYLAKNGIFMPEHAEQLSRPKTLVAQAATLEELIDWFTTRPWPFY